MLDVANTNDVTAYFISKKILAGMRVTDCDYYTVISILTDALLDELFPENLSAVVMMAEFIEDVRHSEPKRRSRSLGINVYGIGLLVLSNHL